MEFCGGGSLLEIIELFPKLILKESHVAYIVREVGYLFLLARSLAHSRSLSPVCTSVALYPSDE